MTTEAVKDKDNTMTFTQIEGLNKTYAHYLLFKEDSPTLNAVIKGLGLQDNITTGASQNLNKPLYKTLLGIRNKEHIAAALSEFGVKKSMALTGFDMLKYGAMATYIIPPYTFFNYEKDMQENAANVNLIHELVINYYPRDAGADGDDKDILIRARADLQKSLKNGYYQGSELIDKEFSETKPQPENIDALKGLSIYTEPKRLIASAKTHYEQYSNLDRNLSAVASLYADAHWVGVEQALQVVATAHTNKSGAVKSAAAASKSAITLEPVLLVTCKFVLNGGSEVDIEIIDYGVNISVDGNEYTNRCFILALARGLDLEPAAFYKKILKLFEPANTTIWNFGGLRKPATETDIKILRDGNDNYINEIKKRFDESQNRQTMIDNGEVEIDNKKIGDYAQPSSMIVKFPKSIPNDEIMIYDNEIRYLNLRTDIQGSDYIDLPEFFKFVHIKEVWNRGLACLILNSGTINVNNVLTKEDLMNASGKKGPELENYKNYLINHKNDGVVIFVGNNITINSIFLINDGGHFYLAKTISGDILNTITDILNDKNKSSGVVNIEEVYVLKYDDVVLGGFKRSAHKTKKRGGHSYRKTHRRK
jgi:hypothetical protein